MTLLPIEGLFFRRLTGNDFLNIERPPMAGEGGGKARFIEIVKSTVPGMLELLDVETREEAEREPISVRVVGDPDVAAPLHIAPHSGGRLRFANQNRRVNADHRHSAWRPERGFPTAPPTMASAPDAEPHLDGVRIYLVKTTDGDYWAGFTSDTHPIHVPAGTVVERLRSDASRDATGVIFGSGVPGAEVNVLRRILDAWTRGKGALLYGPPGTSKTWVASTLYAALRDGGAVLPALFLDPDDAVDPFRVEELDVTLPEPVVVDWLTFHQSYTYEDFVLGLRPQPEDGGTRLKPRLGRLLDRLYDLEQGDAGSAVFFVDEINRGNAARIFGEFITFLDAEYRATDAAGRENLRRLPLPLSALNVENGQTELVERRSGNEVRLPDPWFFPRDVYVLATMNSVDRAAIPIDSALARRFERIELQPDLELLASALGLDAGAAAREWNELSAEETAVRLLDRVNLRLATDLGNDFELGHGLLWSVVEAAPDDRWRALAEAWDDVLFPQIQERYVGRPEEILTIAKLDDPPPDGPYAFRLRTPYGGGDEVRVLDPVRLAREGREVVQNTLRWLAK